MCEVEDFKTILDIKLKNNEQKLIDNMLSFLLIECDEKECDNKELNPVDCPECGNQFSDEHLVICDECEDCC